MHQVYLCDQQVLCLLKCDLYYRFDGTIIFMDKMSSVGKTLENPRWLTWIIMWVFLIEQATGVTTQHKRNALSVGRYYNEKALHITLLFRSCGCKWGTGLHYTCQTCHRHVLVAALEWWLTSLADRQVASCNNDTLTHWLRCKWHQDWLKTHRFSSISLWFNYTDIQQNIHC